jgi:hypothetical protein
MQIGMQSFWASEMGHTFSAKRLMSSFIILTLLSETATA